MSESKTLDAIKDYDEYIAEIKRRAEVRKHYEKGGSVDMFMRIASPIEPLFLFPVWGATFNKKDNPEILFEDWDNYDYEIVLD